MRHVRRATPVDRLRWRLKDFIRWLEADPERVGALSATGGAIAILLVLAALSATGTDLR